MEKHWIGILAVLILTTTIAGCIVSYGLILDINPPVPTTTTSTSSTTSSTTTTTIPPDYITLRQINTTKH